MTLREGKKAKKEEKLLISGDYELIELLVETIFISNLKIMGIKGEERITKRFIDCYSKYFNGIFTKDDDGYIAVFAVSEDEHRDLVEAVKEGVLDVRIYLDDLQEASVKTYIPASVI